MTYPLPHLHLSLPAGTRMRGIFKSVRFRVFQRLAHRVTHRIQRFWLPTRSRYAFSSLPTLFTLEIKKQGKKKEKKGKKKERKKEKKKERKKERKKE